MPQALSTSTARLESSARATLELVAAAMAGEGHLDAAERSTGSRHRAAEVRLRRLPAIIVVLLLSAVVLVGIGVAFVFAVVTRLLATAVSALSSRQHLVALR
ncbi:MAG TPA: hypothetical protein VNJ54_14380 [Plantibacter sp.]|uniref:hypothetical protein n=1 Tax=unclassified Plantibacter TaxID=2624265 RepID=UPI002BC5A276|nr:hypothetical protein [Plantibacter sp.]